MSERYDWCECERKIAVLDDLAKAGKNESVIKKKCSELKRSYASFGSSTFLDANRLDTEQTASSRTSDDALRRKDLSAT